MRDTSEVDRTVVVDGTQELSKREMEDVTGGWTTYGKALWREWKIIRENAKLGQRCYDL